MSTEPIPVDDGRVPAPDIAALKRLRGRLGEEIVRTPVVRCAGLEELLDDGTVVYGKLEFLQRTGTFKARGALANVLALDDAERSAGITAVSAGNHAIAAAFAAQATGISAKVVMIASANPMRIEACRAYGAEIVMADDAHSAFRVVERIQQEEGRAFIHPFEGPGVAAGTGTVGLEICEQVDDFDAVVVAVGGGGLIGGIANAVRRLRPDCDVYGIEPEGADSLRRSLAAGKAVRLDTVNTIADSCGAPFAMPYSFELCRQYVSGVELVSDDDLRHMMGTLFRRMRIAVEPACAAAAAGLFGPLREALRGRRVVLVFCGSNIDWASFERLADLGNTR
jgi:threonine dehydratase